eukprot:g27342.t1
MVWTNFGRYEEMKRIKRPEDSKNEGQMTERAQSQEEEYQQRQIADYFLILEYRKTRLQAPTGVYVIPSLDNLRKWHGVLFLNSGLWAGGIFKFYIKISDDYPLNSEAVPMIFFTSKVAHPLINPSTGQMDVSKKYPRWRYALTSREVLEESPDFIYHLLFYVKKLFFRYEDWLHNRVRQFNPEIAELFSSGAQEDKNQFITRCKQSAAASQKEVYKHDSDSLLRFSEEQEEHKQALDRILNQEKTTGYLSWFADGSMT